jgi:DNA-binding MarR family transcriptional regulator
METKNTLDEIDFPSIIIGKLMNISGILHRESNRLLLPYQLNQQQFSILFEIAKVKQVQQKHMVNRMLLKKAHVSKVVKKLQTMGLIDIIPLQVDKRSALLSPTEKGQKLISECQAIFDVWKKEWFEPFNAKELHQILESIDKLQKTFMSKYSI